MAVLELKVLPAQAQPSGLPCREPSKFQLPSKKGRVCTSFVTLLALSRSYS